MGLLGGYKGAVEMNRVGLLESVPAFVGVQEDTCAPMVSAWNAGRARIAQEDIVDNPQGLAHAIQRGDPTNTYPYLRAMAQNTGGAIVAAHTHDMHLAKGLLKSLGFDACYAAAACLMRRDADGPGGHPRRGQRPADQSHRHGAAHAAHADQHPERRLVTTVADEIARRLADRGVSHVFGYPGETSLSLYAALQRSEEITHVVGRCPRGAAYAAEAYARISGGVAVCDAPGGIGSPTSPRPSWRRTTAVRRWC